MEFFKAFKEPELLAKATKVKDIFNGKNVSLALAQPTQ